MKRLCLILVASCSLVATTAVCGGDDDDDDEPTVVATVEDTPQEFLASSADEIEQLENFHFLLTHENGATQIVLDLEMERAEGEVIVPDRLRADVEAEGPGGVDVDTEVIAIGDDLFFENPFGGGFVDADFSLQDILDPVGGVASLLRTAPDDADFAGSETIDGVDTQRVTATVDSGLLADLIPGGDEGFVVEVTIWIGKEDRLPYRILLVGPLNEEDPEDIERLIDISDFNAEDVEIEAPD
jgi:hypothetical protein